ncbi:indole-3-glycerol phosphate synthase TrpC [Legionella oakridgensis]|uniref:Indole-3-glycerol phosphate synthase n=2 Tax=Legionella oakridgensis TaxID=29423 RepID=W0BC89_9GAMM|nr:indole-3-glycerol phosphate synthase TrpC [Legionella oakridgensis]AHE67470.1 indole-3-glycerol phosphate synthase [Legionella oakridgensis ATCC 33761 = DSM 21215]ETO93000.1 indole-3-glycerol phosphate synthase [Legionella oakridgensis RV-2-2007]KTD43528.1 indole-3-glycerol phosphate synthase [Legionella oakridgensis]STY20520.1 indole-3-glycerol phosphate synthase [Legionella longbeachae]
MNSILNKIAAHKKEEVAKAKRLRPLATFINDAPLPVRNFVAALQSNKPAIIAEIKKASPSKGIIREDFDVATITKLYAQHGAACLSILTDIHYFQGDPSYLAIAKSLCSLPILRKDFIIDPYQLYESRALGADCILLIVAMLDDVQLQEYCQLALELNMAVLVESHTQEELERALLLPTPLIGINNRSLHTFNTDIRRSIDLKSCIPSEKIVISESGIHTREDIEYLQSHGIHAFLIGETLMRSNDIGRLLQTLLLH